MIENISTIVIAFSAFATAGATIVLAVITRRYARTTDQILKANDTPEILIYLFPDERSASSINLCIQNIGTGFASEVKFAGDLSFKPAPYYNLALKHIGVFKNGIDYLPPGKKIEIFLFPTSVIPKLTVKSLNLTVTYVDSVKKQHEDSFFLEFDKWSLFYQRANDPFNKIASTLDDIKRKI